MSHVMHAFAGVLSRVAGERLVPEAGSRKCVCCIQAVSYQPDTPEALTGLGLSYKELGKLQQAEQAFESVLRCQPDNALALGNIAGLYFDQGKLPQVRPPTRHRRLFPGWHRLP